MWRYYRETLYDQIWAHPVEGMAKGARNPGLGLGKVCRTPNIPVPRVRSGRARVAQLQMRGPSAR